MPNPFYILFCLILCSASLPEGRAQTDPVVKPRTDLKTLAVATEAKPDSVIAIPPAVFVTVNLQRGQHASGQDAVDLAAWLNKETSLNGLQSMDSRPWHIVVTYDQFDEDGDNVHSGVYEEYWAGPKKYKRIYKSDNFNQTEYATDKGLYRRGDRSWPDRAESQVRTEVVAPFFYASTLQGFHGRSVERVLGGYKFLCVVIERDSELSDPPQYCFEPDGFTLRYDRGFGWFQTVYNRIALFQGRNIAQEVAVTDGGKPYLKLRVDTIEQIPHVDDADFIPPSDSVGPIGGRISGVQLIPVKTILPEWPASFREKQFTVTVEIVVGKDGRVTSAHGVSGPAEGYKGCEHSVRKWIFQPYLVLDKPVEVEGKISCSHN